MSDGMLPYLPQAAVLLGALIVVSQACALQTATVLPGGTKMGG
jgi:hypothetical protein